MNLDELQKELQDTESYLEKPIASIRRSFRSSKEFVKEENTSTVNNTQPTYSTPESRSELINRLLTEYQKRKANPVIRSKDVQEMFEMEDESITNEEPEEITQNISEDSLYFASDLATNSQPTAGYQSYLLQQHEEGDEYEDEEQREMIAQPHQQQPQWSLPIFDKNFNDSIIENRDRIPKSNSNLTLKSPKRSSSTGRLLSSLQRLSKPKKQVTKDNIAPLSTFGKVLPASYLDDKINSMHSQHKKMMQQREKLKQEHERLALMECTFTPQISSAARKSKLQQQQQQYQQQQPQQPQQPHKQHQQTRRGSVANHPNPPSASLSDRLHEEASIRRKQLHWLSQQLQEESLAECTFQPTIKTSRKKAQSPSSPTTADVNAASSSSISSEHVPIHERVVDLQRQRQRHLHQLKETLEKEQTHAMTFKPKINTKSVAMAEERNAKFSVDAAYDANPKYRTMGMLSDTQEAIRALTSAERDSSPNDRVVERLMNEGKRLQRRKQELFVEREEELMDQCQKTVISKGTHKIAKKSQFVKVDFDTRQKYHEDRVYQHQQEQRTAQQQQQESWFKPQVESKKSERILAVSRPEVLYEDQSSRIRRLSTMEAVEKATRQKELEEDYYNQISFTPEINPISKLFGRKSSVTELYANESGRHHMNQLKLKVESETNQECTFTPKINEYSKEITSSEYDDYDDLYQQYFQQSIPRGYESEGERKASNEEPKKTRGVQALGRINFEQPEKMVSEIHLHRLQKESRRQQELILREIEELQECTFRPNLAQNHSFADITSTSMGDVNDARYDNDGGRREPIIVKGLARHMELQELSKKLKEEKATREHAAFNVVNVDGYRRPEDGSTIVKPFYFATGEKNSPSPVQAAPSSQRYYTVFT